MRVKITNLVLMAACLGLAALLVANSPLASEGARQGLILCGQVIIPSMYPFFVLCSLLTQLELRPARRRGALLWAMLRQPPAALWVILLGFLGGYPVGAKISAQMLERGMISRPQAQRLQLFCVNAGPAYLIGAVGAGLIGSRRAGLILFISMVASALALGVVTRFLAAPEESVSYRAAPEASVSFGAADKRQEARKYRPLDQAILAAVTQATGAILGVCAWVVLFSTLCALLRMLPMALWPAIPFLNVFLEVSTGAVGVIRATALPVLCAALGWGGLSVHCQIMGDLRKTGLPLRLFWVSRLLHGALAAAICSRLLRRFPIELPAAAMRAGWFMGARLWAVSAPAAAALLIFCAFLILDLDLNRKIC